MVNLFKTSSSAYGGTVEIALDGSKQKALKIMVFRAFIFRLYNIYWGEILRRKAPQNDK